MVGIKGDGNNYKYMKLQKDTVTTKRFEKAKTKWDKKAKKQSKKPKKKQKNMLNSYK